MIDENGKVMTEKEILLEALHMMSEVCCLLFETKEASSIAAAYMADSLIKYLQVIYRDHDVLLAAANYSTYEERLNQTNVIPMSKL